MRENLTSRQKKKTKKTLTSLAQNDKRKSLLVIQIQETNKTTETPIKSQEELCVSK